MHPSNHSPEHPPEAGVLSQAERLAARIASGIPRAETAADYDALSAQLRQLTELFKYGAFLPRGELTAARNVIGEAISGSPSDHLVNQMQFSGSGRQLLAAYLGDQVALFEPAAGGGRRLELATSKSLGEPQGITQAVLTADDQLIAAVKGSSGGDTIHLLSTTRKTLWGGAKEEGRIQLPCGINGLIPLPDAAGIAAIGSDRILRIFSVAPDLGGKKRWGATADGSFQFPLMPCHAVFDPRTQDIIAADYGWFDEGSRIYRLQRDPLGAPSGIVEAERTERPYKINCVAISGDGQLLAVAGEIGGIQLWRRSPQDVLPISLPPSVVIESSAVRTLDLNRDGSLLAVVAEDGVLRVFSTQEFDLEGFPKEIASFKAAKFITRVKFDRDGGKIAVGYSNGAVHVIGQ